MKLSKKLMLFEEFTEVKTSVSSGSAETSQTDTKVDIIQDVDSIISKLEDLASNLSSEPVHQTNESVEIVTEGAADQILSAELYMLPIIAAGLTGAAAVGTGILIKKALTRKKIKSLFNKHVAKLKFEAAEKKIKKAGADSEEKKKLEDEIDKLESAAGEMYSALGEKYSKFSDLLAALNADLNLEITTKLIKSGALTDSQLERAKKTQQNAKVKVEKVTQDSKEKKKKGKELVDNASEEDREKIKSAAEEAKEKMEEDSSKDPKVKKLEDEIADLEDKLEGANPNPKDKKSRDNLEILKSAIDGKKKQLAKLKQGS